jgi:lipopolysaccharide heptosyltransferase II
MKSLRHVLIVQPYGIGDLLFVTPVLRALRLIPTVEKVDLLLGSRTEQAVRDNPHVDEIFTLDKDLFHRRDALENFQDVLSLGRRLRKQNYDLLLDYSLRGENAFFSQFFLRIPRRAGFDYKRRGFFHNIRLPIPEGFHERHVVDYFCDLAEKAGIPVEDRFLEFYLSPSERETARQLITEKIGDSPGNFLVVSPGGGESWGNDAHFRRWPVRFFGEMIEWLSHDLELKHVFIIASSGEKALGQELAGLTKIPCVNLAGEISLSQAAALIEKAVLFVCNDSGLVHVAHALDVPLVALYGPVDPMVYGPYPPSSEAMVVFKKDLACRPCYQKFRYNSACVGRECLQDFTPKEVFGILQSQGFFARRLNVS